MTTDSERSFKLFLVISGCVAVSFLILIFTLPLILSRLICRKRKVSTSSSGEEHLLQSDDEELYSKKVGHRKIKMSEMYYENTEIDIALEYRTRGTKLIIGVANVRPSSNAWRFLKETGNGQLFLLVYLDGDSVNSPCESTKHKLERKIFFNEIFIFTVMPYDLSTLSVVVQTVLVCGNLLYDIGALVLTIGEQNDNFRALSKIHQMPFPSERGVVHECLLSLAILKCKNAIKIKVLKLYFLKSCLTEQSLSGVHLRVQVTDFLNPMQVLDTTKKRGQQCVTFNELLTFEFVQPINTSLEIEIQLLESYNTENTEELISVSGRTVIYIVKDDEAATFAITKNNSHLLEVINNPDVEIVRWHGIPYVRSIK